LPAGAVPDLSRQGCADAEKVELVAAHAAAHASLIAAHSIRAAEAGAVNIVVARRADGLLRRLGAAAFAFAFAASASGSAGTVPTGAAVSCGLEHQVVHAERRVASCRHRQDG
jgi:hypothetical protein